MARRPLPPKAKKNLQRVLSGETGLPDLEPLAKALGRRKEAGRLATTIGVGGSMISIGKVIYDKIEEAKNKKLFNVTITSDDDLFYPVQEWLLDRIPVNERQSLAAISRRDYSASGRAKEDSAWLRELKSKLEGSVARARRAEHRLVLAYDGSKAQTITFDGHKVSVTVETPESQAAKRKHGGPDSDMPAAPINRSRVVFTCPGYEAQQAVVAFLTEITTALGNNEFPRLFVGGKWGDWSLASTGPPRSIDTVILQEGVAEGLCEDLDRFLLSEDRYGSLGIPWHRGYLLHGPPGTGKTSIAKAIAGSFNLDTYYLSISDLKEDSDLAEHINSVRPGSMLLLEDIDVVHGSHTRDDKEPGVTLTGLLNVLDGVMTPHGLVTVMTTNNISVLDSALIRPGRADYVVEIGEATREQIVRLCSLIAGRTVASHEIPAAVPVDLTPAEILEWAKADLDNPEGAFKIVVEHLKEAVRSVL